MVRWQGDGQALRRQQSVILLQGLQVVFRNLPLLIFHNPYNAPAKERTTGEKQEDLRASQLKISKNLRDDMYDQVTSRFGMCLHGQMSIKVLTLQPPLQHQQYQNPKSGDKVRHCQEEDKMIEVMLLFPREVCKRRVSHMKTGAVSFISDIGG